MKKKAKKQKSGLSESEKKSLRVMADLVMTAAKEGQRIGVTAMEFLSLAALAYDGVR